MARAAALGPAAPGPAAPSSPAAVPGLIAPPIPAAAPDLAAPLSSATVPPTGVSASSKASSSGDGSSPASVASRPERVRGAGWAGGRGRPTPRGLPLNVCTRGLPPKRLVLTRCSQKKGVCFCPPGAAFSVTHDSDDALSNTICNESEASARSSAAVWALAESTIFEPRSRATMTVVFDEVTSELTKTQSLSQRFCR